MASAERWKYLVVSVKPGFFGQLKAETMQAELDQHGAVGWELVSVVAPPATRTPQLVFKRPA